MAQPNLKWGGRPTDPDTIPLPCPNNELNLQRNFPGVRTVHHWHSCRATYWKMSAKATAAAPAPRLGQLPAHRLHVPDWHSTRWRAAMMLHWRHCSRLRNLMKMIQTASTMRSDARAALPAASLQPQEKKHRKVSWNAAQEWGMRKRSRFQREEHESEERGQAAVA